jgi:hypothetical protein
VYLREGRVLPVLDIWLARLFAPDQLDHTCQLLAGVSGGLALVARQRAAQRTLVDCDARLARYRATLDAGGDPAVVAKWIKETQAQRAVAEQQLQAITRSTRGLLGPYQLREIVERAGSAVRTLSTARPANKQRVYTELGLRLTYHPAKQKVSVEARPHGGVYQSQCRRIDTPIPGAASSVVSP